MVSAGKHGRLQEAVVREAVHSTHGQRREAWKTTESSGVMENGYPKYRYADCHQLGFLGYCWDRPTVL